jgi:predicted DNA binding CopG/RHH family protein
MIGRRAAAVKEEYDFSKAKKNPYTKRLRKQITINIDSDTIKYFKDQAADSGIPYQTLINLYLTDCAVNKKKLQLAWK